MAVAAMVVSSAAMMMLNPEADWSFRTELGGALLVTEAYYLVFQYLAFSALVFIVAELIFRLDHRSSIARANVAAFVLHSSIFVVLGFRGELRAFWVVWFVLVVVNLLMPRALSYTPASRFLR